MTDILVLAFFRFARCQRLRGVFALQHLHPGLFIAAMTTRPCSKKRRALMYKEQMSCALPSKSASWLFSH